jgi:tRNA A-37 threonylcarbamoyl transferase component Bud32
MAPQLYGTSSIQEIASVIVMGLLEDGWVTLFHYRENVHRNGIPEPGRRTLLTRLEKILDCLSTGGMVHGDFRMANIMLKPGEEEKAMVIDFDWAGEAGTVRYPVTRSEEFDYPGRPGEPIEAKHDREYYESWKGEL